MGINKKKTALKYTKERVLFSDILPYEVPLIFSNRYFYRFLIKNKIEIEGNRLKWGKTTSDEDFEVIKFLLCLFDTYKADKSKLGVSIENKQVSIPFTYSIEHKESSLRYLSIIHPLNQLKVVEFYNKYKSLILQHCSISNYSVRFPAKMASYYFYKDKLHSLLIGSKVDGKEVFMNEYENLKSYFSYKYYPQIYRMYESERYQTAEKKYEKLFRFDIQSCFDSIYTHSIEWATTGNKTIYKHNYINDKIKKRSSSFGSEFDNLMQRMNFNETNGILIGPEFSRIFAEIILQHIDSSVEQELLNDYRYKQGLQYECYRYVDDFFVYYNDEKVRSKIAELFSLKLKEFKMGFNEAKSEFIERPLITNISIAKDKIDEFLREKLRIDFTSQLLPECSSTDGESNVEDETTLEETILNKYLNEDISLFFNHTNFNMKYKIIIKEANVKYRDIINYTLSRISTRLERIFKTFDKRFKYLSYYSQNIDKIENLELQQICIAKCLRYEKLLVSFLLGIVDSVFFLYSSNKRINTTLKVVSILNIIILYLKNNYNTSSEGKFIRFQHSSIQSVFRKIQSEVLLSIETASANKHTQLESLYLLLPLKELGPEYNVPISIVDNCILNDSGDIPLNNNILVTLLLIYYFGKQKEYAERLISIKNHIKSKIEAEHIDDRRRNTELMILVMDSLTCPYFDSEFKKELLTLFGVKDTDDNMIRDKIITASLKQKVWFTKWENFNLNYELSAKVSQEVYS